MNFDPKGLVNGLIEKNPNLRNNRNSMAMINAILNNDEAAGTEIANNLLKTYGVTKEDALDMAKKRFGLQ